MPATRKLPLIVFDWLFELRTFLISPSGNMAGMLSNYSYMVMISSLKVNRFEKF